MKETKTTVSLLTAENLDWYEAALPRVTAFGLANTFEEREDRNLFRSIEKALGAVKVARKGNGQSGKKPVETKLHYRWTEFEASTLRAMVDAEPTEVSALAIIKDEICRALSKYQPVLDMRDTTKRFAFGPLEGLLLEDAVELGRVANFDRAAWCAATAAEFAEDWNPDFLTRAMNNPAPLGAVIPETAADAYRAKVRDEIEFMTREVYPSVAAIVA